MGKENNNTEKQIKCLELGNKHYKQTFPNSCAIACYMMVKSLSNNEEFSLDRENEQRLLEKFDNHLTITELMKLALTENFNIKVFSEIDYREIVFKETFKETVRKGFIDFFNEMQYDIDFHFKKPLEPTILRNLLMDRNAVLVNGTIHGIPHMRLVSGYKDDEFLVNDPLCDTETILTFSALSEISKPPMGQFYFSLKENDTDRIRKST